MSMYVRVRSFVCLLFCLLPTKFDCFLAHLFVVSRLCALLFACEYLQSSPVYALFALLKSNMLCPQSAPRAEVHALAFLYVFRKQLQAK